MGAQIEYLHPEIANEGESVDDWQPFVAKPVIPTYAGIKSIAKYFPEFSGIPYKHRAFPAWLYHPTKAPVLVRSAEAAKNTYGATWREATHEERAKGFPPFLWDYTGEWRAIPFTTKFDAANPDTGKTVVLAPERGPSQAEMISAVVSAVVAQMNSGGKGNALASTDPDYVEFQAFKAWKVGQQPSGGDKLVANGSMLSEYEQKKLLVEAADSRGVKLDGRWSLDRIKEELGKVSDD